MEDTDQVVFYEPRLLLVEVGEGRFSTVLQHGDGTVERLPVTTPARDLIAAAEINYWPYRREIKRLRDDHPLFAARLDIPVADFEDFMTETLLLPSMLQKIDPVGFFALGGLAGSGIAEGGRWQRVVLAGRGTGVAARAGGADLHTDLPAKYSGDGL